MLYLLCTPLLAVGILSARELLKLLWFQHLQAEYEDHTASGVLPVSFPSGVLPVSFPSGGVLVDCDG